MGLRMFVWFSSSTTKPAASRRMNRTYGLTMQSQVISFFNPLFGQKTPANLALQVALEPSPGFDKMLNMFVLANGLTTGTSILGAVYLPGLLISLLQGLDFKNGIFLALIILPMVLCVVFGKVLEVKILICRQEKVKSLMWSKLGKAKINVFQDRITLIKSYWPLMAIQFVVFTLINILKYF